MDGKLVSRTPISSDNKPDASCVGWELRRVESYTACYSAKAGEGVRSWISSVLFVAW